MDAKQLEELTKKVLDISTAVKKQGDDQVRLLHVGTS